MSHRSRPLNRFAVALALVAMFVGGRLGVHMFAAPTVTFDTLPNLNFNQGQKVTVAFAAAGFPTGVTYSADGLPAGLSMTMGIDTLGHTVGILGGTLAADTPEGGGSEGVYNVRLRASDGAVSNVFTVDVSHWNEGDVFVGGGQWVYQVYRQDSTFKNRVTVPDDANITEGYTTGCAVNWHSGEVWATNFDDVYPALNVITRHAGSNPLPFTDPSRRLSTERYGVAGALTPFPGNMNPFDITPESVAFDNDGNMFVGHSFGFWNDNGDVADANGNTIIVHSPTGAGWIYVDATGAPLLDINGKNLYDSDAISPAGFFERWVPGGTPENILGPNGQPIPVPIQGGMDVHRYAVDANGNYHQNDRKFFDFHYGNTGVDTLDLLSDQKTAIYTSEDWYVHRYDLSTSTQLPVLGSTIVGESHPIHNAPTYGLRALPPGDGSGGYLIVNELHIERTDANGRVVQIYDIHNDPDYPGNDSGWSPNDVNGWFAIAIAPGGRSFWAATRTDVFHFDLASGALLGPKITATIGTLHTPEELAGLCVMDEYRAAQEVCGPTGLGNGIDDDMDGTIDEGCFRVEICSTLSPGDDDGDGLVDYNDPDCGAVPAQQCVTSGPTDNSVAGICERADYEGDSVVVPGIPRPCPGGDCTNWTFNITATGLPPGLTIDPWTGDVTGTPLFSIVNPNSETSAPVVYHVTVNSMWKFVNTPAANFTNTFNWTIYNRNRAPVANDDGPQAVNSGGQFTFDVRLNDNDIDGDTFTINSFTQPPAGQGTVAQVGQNLVYTAPASGYSGITTFTYTVKDTYNPAGISNAATVTVRVNNLPVAVNDSYTTNKNVPLLASVAGNDTPSIDGGNIWSVTSQPVSGNVVMLPGGGFTYTPALNFTGTVSFNYRVCDVDNDCSMAVATIRINDAPVAVNDSFTTPKNTALNASVTGNDTASADAPNVWTKTSNPLHGGVTMTAAGAFTYTPVANYTGSDSFTYKVCDVDNDCATATVTIKINDVPVAVDDSYTTPKNTPLVATVTGNDTASADGGNVWANTSNPSHGTLAMALTGGFTYTPATGYSGTDSFTYFVCDTDHDCSSATVRIKINDVPVAVTESYTTPRGAQLVASVTNNDILSADGVNVWSLAVAPTSGFLTIAPNGTFNYTPDLNFAGTVTFTYKICDVDNDCSTTVDTIRINDVPLARNDFFTTPKNVALTTTSAGNDIPSVDGGNIWTKLTDPSHGTATMTGAGGFTYTPIAGYTGLDTFTYKLCDVDTDCSNATVTIKINDVPVAVNDTYTTPKNAPVFAAVAVNDTPSADGPNVWTVTSGTSHGTVSMTSLGSFSYAPATGYTGTDSFTYTICDADGDCATATATITIVNHVPVAGNDTFTMFEDTVLNATATSNDTASADGGNVWSRVTNAANGNAVVNTDGTFVYTPNANFNGVDSFTYKVCDGDGDCSTATVTITITPVNDVPVAVNDAFTTPEDTVLNGTVKGNDTPSGDGGNVWTLVSATTHGTVTVNADGTFTYTPNANYNGTDAFTYKVCDVDGDCATAIATITITPVNDLPVAKNDAFTTNEDTPVAGSLTGNDTLSGDGGNVWSLVTGAGHGVAIVNADGTFSYTPAANFNGVDTFSYKICDVDGDCSTAIVTITIISVNDVPEALDDSYTAQEDTLFTSTVVTNDTLSGDGGNVWTLVSTTSHGTLTFTNGAFTYMPNKDYNGTDSFVYKLCDVNGDCSTATAIITINPTNDVPVAVNDVYSMAPNTSITKDVSGNDTASGDGGNVWTKTSNPTSGTVVFNADGTFTYTAAVGFSGVVTFNYKLCDANNDCSNATVTITIAALVTGAVGKGDTATIGFWQNQNGQALILKVNGSAASTSLGNWLAASFPSMWGANGGAANNLTGKSNTQVAAYYLTVFKSDKWTAQVLAGAIASYVTSSTLSGGNYSVPYGFNYSVTGTGTKTYNVGSYGTAIGLVNNTSYTVGALLQQANLRKLQGTYNSNAFNVIFSGINVLGDIVK